MAQKRDSAQPTTTTTTEARQGSPRKLNLRVLIESMLILGVISLVAAAVFYS